MSDIFLSYASQDLDRVKALAAALESQGWTVFFDRTIPPGKTWRQFIGKEIDECRCMIVAWSKHSVNSNWVEVETDIGLKRKILIPLFLDQVTPPLGFGAIQGANLINWQGKTDASGYLSLCKGVAELIGPGIPKASKAYTTPPKQINDPKTKIRWPKQFSVKVGIVTIIMATLSILFWVVPGFFSHKDKDIPIEAPSVNPNVIDLIPIKKPEVVKIPDSSNQLSSNAGDHNEKRGLPDKSLIKEPEMVRIPGDEFWMGSADDDKKAMDDEKPSHKVWVATFALGKYEVTKAQFATFVDDSGYKASGCWTWNGSKWVDNPDKDWRNPGFDQTDNDPVTCVSYNDAVAYIRWLNTKTGRLYRLPTEAEWEYAARAKTTSAYFWGEKEADQYAWFDKNSGDKTHPVNKLNPNKFGLYGMAGNVWEWVQDCYVGDYSKAPIDGSAWDSKDCSRRVLRGGSWTSDRGNLRSANRGWSSPDTRGYSIGFRLAQD